jgi:hypothetical protein
MYTYQAALSGSDCDEVDPDSLRISQQKTLDIALTPKFTQVNINEVIPLVSNLGSCDSCCLRTLLRVMTILRLSSCLHRGLWSPSGSSVIGVGQKSSSRLTSTSLTWTSAKRYLAFLFYLNDDFEGGETDLSSDKSSNHRRGKVLVFPPTWQYPTRWTYLLQWVQSISCPRTSPLHDFNR